MMLVGPGYGLGSNQDADGRYNPALAGSAIKSKWDIRGYYILVLLWLRASSSHLASD